MIATTGDLKLSVSHDLTAIEAEWRRFEETADCTVFQTFDWLATWQKHVGARLKAVPAIVLGRGPGDELLFILPLAVYPKGWITELGFLGRDLCDYNAPLLAPSFPTFMRDFPALWREICARLQRDRLSRHDLILLDKMPDRVGSQANPFLALGPNLNASGAYLTKLFGDWESFYAAKRSSSTRRRDRTKRKRLAESGEVRFITPQSNDAAAATLATLMEQKSRAFARMGVPDMFERPGYREFFSELATNPQIKLAHVSNLEVGPTLAATNLGLVFRGGYYHVLASYDDGPVSKYGPGAAHLHDLMRYALEHGCTFFDFTIGDEGYKRDWSDTEIALYDYIQGVSWRGRAVAAAQSQARHIKRSIKQSERLWPLVSRLRARLGRLRRT